MLMMAVGMAGFLFGGYFAGQYEAKKKTDPGFSDTALKFSFVGLLVGTAGAAFGIGSVCG